MIALVSCFSNPFSPAMSAGVLQPASNSSIKSFGFFIRSPSISEDRLHKMIYTLDGSARRNHGRQLASRLIEVFNSIWSGKVQQYSVEHRAGTERCVGHSFRRIVR